MAALAADRQTRIKAGGGTRYNRGDVKANAVIYNGALIAHDAAGWVVPASDTAALKVIGIAQEQVDNTGGANGAKTVGYITGVAAELGNAGAAIVQAGKHVLCMVNDDNSVTTAAVAANDVVAGLVMSFTAALVWVYVDEVIGQTA